MDIYGVIQLLYVSYQYRFVTLRLEPASLKKKHTNQEGGVSVSNPSVSLDDSEQTPAAEAYSYYPLHHRERRGGGLRISRPGKGWAEHFCLVPSRPVPSRPVPHSIQFQFQFLPILRAVELFDEVSGAWSRRRVCSNEARVLPREVIRHGGGGTPAPPAVVEVV